MQNLEIDALDESPGFDLISRFKNSAKIVGRVAMAVQSFKRVHVTEKTAPKPPMYVHVLSDV